MEESLEEFLKRDMNEQIDDMLFSNYVEKGQAISIKEKTESPFLDNTMEKILNQIKYEEKYKKYENLDKKSLYWKVMMIGGAFSGNIAQNSVYNYLHYYEPSTINEENYNHISFFRLGNHLTYSDIENYIK